MFRPTFSRLFSCQITHKNVSVWHQLIIEYLLHEINFLKSWKPNNNGTKRLVQILEGSGYVCRSREAVYRWATGSGAYLLGVVPFDSVPGAWTRHTDTFFENLLLQVLHQAECQGVLHCVPHRDAAYCRSGYPRLRHPARPWRRQRGHAHQLRLFCSWTSWYDIDQSTIKNLNA